MQWIVGRPPFVGETLTDTLQDVVNKDPVSPRLLNPSVRIHAAIALARATHFPVTNLPKKLKGPSRRRE
jgi:hypothetical protein